MIFFLCAESDTTFLIYAVFLKRVLAVKFCNFIWILGEIFLANRNIMRISCERF